MALKPPNIAFWLEGAALRACCSQAQTQIAIDVPRIWIDHASVKYGLAPESEAASCSRFCLSSWLYPVQRNLLSAFILAQGWERVGDSQDTNCFKSCEVTGYLFRKAEPGWFGHNICSSTITAFEALAMQMSPNVTRTHTHTNGIY